MARLVEVASWVGAFALVSITLVSLGIFAFSQDQQKSQEAVRFLTIIIGAAAGTIFTYHLGKSN